MLERLAAHIGSYDRTWRLPTSRNSATVMPGWFSMIRSASRSRGVRVLNVMWSVERRTVEDVFLLTGELAALRIEEAGLSKLIESFESDLAEGFNKTVAMVLDTKGRTIVSGMGKSGHVARKIAATMASTGTLAHFVHPGEASHGDLGLITHHQAELLRRALYSTCPKPMQP